METKRYYKDSVFVKLFNDKEKMIELFNAMEGTDYGLDTEVGIQTLDNVLYNGKKNDLAFSIDNRYIILTEHQSTICLLRMLIYVSKCMSEY